MTAEEARYEESKKELARILDILLSEWREGVDYEALKAAADWHTLKINEYEAAQQSVHLTGGSHAVGEANSENYVRWQNGDLPEEPASR